MFKKILILFVLFIAISCRQNTAPLLVSPPKEDDGITDEDNTGNDNSEGDNTGGGDTGGPLYGYYNVYILGNADPQKLSISNTDKMFKIYTNMILNTDKKPKFKLTKSDSVPHEVTTPKSYVFNSNLDIIEESADGQNSTTAPYKKFRGVCIVRIYPDAEVKSDNSSLLGYYTIAGVYTEMPESARASYRAMEKSQTFQNPGYDELIILRTDKKISDTASDDSDTSGNGSSDTSGNDTLSYRADILFNDDEGINFYYYNPDRTFKYQNINYIFERIVSETTTK